MTKTDEVLIDTLNNFRVSVDAFIETVADLKNEIGKYTDLEKELQELNGHLRNLESVSIWTPEKKNPEAGL